MCMVILMLLPATSCKIIVQDHPVPVTGKRIIADTIYFYKTVIHKGRYREPVTITQIFIDLLLNSKCFRGCIPVHFLLCPVGNQPFFDQAITQALPVRDKKSYHLYSRMGAI